MFSYRALYGHCSGTGRALVGHCVFVVLAYKYQHTHRVSEGFLGWGDESAPCISAGLEASDIQNAYCELFTVVLFTGGTHRQVGCRSAGSSHTNFTLWPYVFSGLFFQYIGWKSRQAPALDNESSLRCATSKHPGVAPRRPTRAHGPCGAREELVRSS